MYHIRSWGNDGRLLPDWIVSIVVIRSFCFVLYFRKITISHSWQKDHPLRWTIPSTAYNNHHCSMKTASITQIPIAGHNDFFAIPVVNHDGSYCAQHEQSSNTRNLICKTLRLCVDVNWNCQRKHLHLFRWYWTVSLYAKQCLHNDDMVAEICNYYQVHRWTIWFVLFWFLRL